MSAFRAFRDTSHQWARISVGDPVGLRCGVAQQRAAEPEAGEGAHETTQSCSPWLCASSVEAPYAMSIEAPAGMPTVAVGPGQWDMQGEEPVVSPTGVWGMPSPSEAAMAATWPGPGPWAPPTSWSAACPASTNGASSGSVRWAAHDQQQQQPEAGSMHVAATQPGPGPWAPPTSWSAGPASPNGASSGSVHWPAHDRQQQQPQQQQAESMHVAATQPGPGPWAPPASWPAGPASPNGASAGSVHWPAHDQQQQQHATHEGGMSGTGLSRGVIRAADTDAASEAPPPKRLCVVR